MVYPALLVLATVGRKIGVSQDKLGSHQPFPAELERLTVTPLYDLGNIYPMLL